MGIVYEAVQQSLGRHVALKVLPRHSLLDPKKLQRFHREAQAAARLHHTNIVPVFGVGEHDGLHYYVMQLIPGQGLNGVLDGLRQRKRLQETLGEVTPKAPQLSTAGDGAKDSTLTPSVMHERLDAAYWRWVARLGVQAAEALEYAHQQGTLHRDIKPANLLLDQQGTLWVTDFGLAKWTAGSSDGNPLTNSGDVVGTLNYLAPECFHGKVDARSDVYSLGLTLYELLTQEPPFAESNPALLIRQVSERTPPPPRKLNPAIPRDLETIVLKAISREPEHRYPKAADLAEDLKRFLDDRPIRARRANAAERCWRWCRRNRTVTMLMAATAAGLLLAAAAGWVGYVQTTAALDRESTQRKEANANLMLSWQAFEEIFHNMADDLAPTGQGEDDLPAAPPDEGKLALLQSVLRFYDRFAQRNATNPNLLKEAAKASSRVATIYQRLRQPAQAKTAYQRALAIYEQLAVQFQSDSAYQFGLAEVLARIDPPPWKPEILPDTERHLRRAVTLLEDLAAKHQADGLYAAARGRAQRMLGLVLYSRRQAGPAEAYLRKAVAGHAALINRFGEEPAHRIDLATARQSLAEVLREANKMEEVRSLLQASVENLKTLLPNRVRYASRDRLLAAHYQMLVEACNGLGRYEEAQQAFVQAMTIKMRWAWPQN
jgi:tetratricopeptide (TPR) repeat protein